ncbi:MAG: hypothetical protein SCALA702_09720 [Melioribacteraceae bacterium]|nr:MAG: hypothetical protein SCALA702_09720 [Melioribacteraceae bacterium]
MTYYEDRNVLITGGAGGIGLLMAELIGKAGGNIIIWDNNQQNMIDAQKRLNELKINAAFFHCDLSSRDEINKAAEETLKRHRYVDILINNAGYVSGKEFEKCTEEEMEFTFKVNTLAHFYTVRAFLPGMEDAGFGQIVTIASAAALIGTSGLADYSASKFAVAGFTESLRAEFRRKKKNIKTTLVCPYYINTGMFDGVKTRFSFLLPILEPEKVAKKVVKAIAKQRVRIYMPWIVYTVHLVKFLPMPIFDFVAGLLGLQQAMNNFKGRK